jgi:hypothetical protein
MIKLDYVDSISHQTVRTPKHGSWLNIAEIELSVLCGQCLDQRLPDQQSLKQVLAAWEAERNALMN